LFWFLKSFCSRELAVPGSFWGKRKSESKNCWVWLFQKLQRTGSFLKRTAKKQVVVQANLIFLKFSENPGDISGIGSVSFLRTMVMNPKNAALIIRGGPFPFLLTAQCWS
jgi:hypothetical protein